jgi:putative transposase
LTELKNRGLPDILIACLDGRKGFPQAIEAVYPQTSVQLCIVPLARGRWQDASWKERRAVAQDLRSLYQAATGEKAEQEREVFTARWDRKYPTISALWRRHGEQITPLWAFPPEIRKIIYTTNAVESLPMTLRQVINTCASFPNEEAAMKLLYLALRNVSQRWGLLPNWKEALNRFAILWEARFPQNAL